MNYYRFSISWARILPTGDIADINEAGIRYYDNVINKLLVNNIEPMSQCIIMICHRIYKRSVVGQIQ